MLQLSDRGTVKTCDGVTRRDFLQVGALGAVGLTLAATSGGRGTGRGQRTTDNRSCIMIFNLGAPSQMDTFDPSRRRRRSPRAVPPDLHQRLPGDSGYRNPPPARAGTATSSRLSAVAITRRPPCTTRATRCCRPGRCLPAASTRRTRAASRVPARAADRSARPRVLPEPMGRTGGNLPHGQDAGFLGKAYDPFSLMADPSQARLPSARPVAAAADRRDAARAPPPAAARSSIRDGQESSSQPVGRS
jgi:hypothetical protein